MGSKIWWTIHTGECNKKRQQVAPLEHVDYTLTWMIRALTLLRWAIQITIIMELSQVLEHLDNCHRIQLGCNLSRIMEQLISIKIMQWDKQIHLPLLLELALPVQLVKKLMQIRCQDLLRCWMPRISEHAFQIDILQGVQKFHLQQVYLGYK